MKKILVVFTLVFSANSFAISTPALIQKCAGRGIEKLLAQAQTKNCEGDENELNVREVDNRITSPSKYVWYSLNVTCSLGNEELIEMVQYSTVTRECI